MGFILVVVVGVGGTEVRRGGERKGIRGSSKTWGGGGVKRKERAQSSGSPTRLVPVHGEQEPEAQCLGSGARTPGN